MKTLFGIQRLRNSKGAVIVEFAMIALIFYVLFAATLSFGKLFFAAQTIQDVARVAARELSLIELPHNATFNTALSQVFDETQLVIDIEACQGADSSLDPCFQALPQINQALRPLMIFDEIEGVRVLRYPGAVYEDPSNPGSYLITIPVISETRGPDGEETILQWVNVVEEIANTDGNSPYPLANGGYAAVRINYPYQSASLSGFQRSDTSVLDPNLDSPILSNDSDVGGVEAPGDLIETGIVNDAGNRIGPYAGTYGLGRQLAFASEVRPFRKFLSAQSIYPREVIAR